MKLLPILVLVATLAAPLAAVGQDTQTSAEGNDAQAPTDPASGGDHRIFGVMPNFTTVEDGRTAPPVDAHQKFRMASLNTFDPFVYPFVGVIALMNRSYGSGTSGYVKQYAASLTDNVTGNFMTTAILPSVLHQDPRYFERGSGGVLHRVAYAASRTAVTRGDSGAAQFNVSEVAGNAIAAGLSNFYYPSAKRTVGSTLARCGMQVTWDSLSNELKEFWPDIRRMLH